MNWIPEGTSILALITAVLTVVSTSVTIGLSIARYSKRSQAKNAIEFVNDTLKTEENPLRISLLKELRLKSQTTLATAFATPWHRIFLLSLTLPVGSTGLVLVLISLDASWAMVVYAVSLTSFLLYSSVTLTYRFLEDSISSARYPRLYREGNLELYLAELGSKYLSKNRKKIVAYAILIVTLAALIVGSVTFSIRGIFPRPALLLFMFAISCLVPLYDSILTYTRKLADPNESEFVRIAIKQTATREAPMNESTLTSTKSVKSDSKPAMGQKGWIVAYPDGTLSERLPDLEDARELASRWSPPLEVYRLEWHKQDSKTVE